MLSMKTASLLATALLLSSTAMAAQIVPANPVQFEHLHLRLTVDSCSFDKSTVRVELRDHTLAVFHQPLACLVPGPPEVADIQLGAFPAGDYQAEVYVTGSDTPDERIAFHVSSIPYIAVFPALPFPVADYSGLWDTATEPGWGLSLHQGARHTLFGALFVFDAQRQPQWYTLQAGTWETTTRWKGQLIKSEGTPWTATNWIPATYTPVGTATLDFGMVSGQEDVAKFTYVLNGQTVVKAITRTRL
jgi:hypothetical protein